MELQKMNRYLLFLAFDANLRYLKRGHLWIHYTFEFKQNLSIRWTWSETFHYIQKQNKREKGYFKVNDELGNNWN